MTDLIIVGSGFGGSLMAMIARKLGFSVVLLEKSSHPRFVIGESTTPLTNLYLEQIADRYQLTQLRSLSKWGTWQKNHPEIPVGLKRGFSFFHHEMGKPFVDDPDHSHQLLVAASPHDGIGDTHWYRPAFDEQLVKWVVQTGVDYYDKSRITNLQLLPDKVALTFGREGNTHNVEAKFLVDATGPYGFLFNELGLKAGSFPHLPDRETLYTHFKGVKAFSIHSHQSGQELPYPVNNAAVHHLFDGGWIWVLQFNNGITSAGVSLRKDKAKNLRLSEGETGWYRLLEHLPGVRDQFIDAEPVMPFTYQPQMSYRSDQIVSNRWAMLPAAAGFVDPMMSTGFPLNLRGIMRLATMLEDHPDLDNLESTLSTYDEITRKEQDLGSLMIGALWASFNDFELFSALSLIYFTAASYSESAIRLNKPELAPSFLLDDHPEFGPNARKYYEKALGELSQEERQNLIKDIYETIEPFDVAGLTDRSRKNWYPVCAEDTLRNAEKLGVAEEDVKESMKRSGFFV